MRVYMVKEGYVWRDIEHVPIAADKEHRQLAGWSFTLTQSGDVTSIIVKHNRQVRYTYSLQGVSKLLLTSHGAAALKTGHTSERYAASSILAHIPLAMRSKLHFVEMLPKNKKLDHVQFYHRAEVGAFLSDGHLVTVQTAYSEGVKHTANATFLVRTLVDRGVVPAHITGLIITVESNYSPRHLARTLAAIAV